MRYHPSHLCRFTLIHSESPGPKLRLVIRNPTSRIRHQSQQISRSVCCKSTTMAITPSTHSRTSSTASSCSSSSTYRLFPRTPKSADRPQPHNPAPTLHSSPSSSYASVSSFRNQRQHIAASPSVSLSTSHRHRQQLTTSIERVTVPMLAHLHNQLSYTHLEPERDRVWRQIQRQETVLTLSMILKIWEEDDDERSRWSDDSEDEDEDEGEEEGED